MNKIITLLSILFFLSQSMVAQDIIRERPDFENGDVVISSTGRVADGNLMKSNGSYSDLLVGVFAEKTETRNIPLIIESGIAYVKFDSRNGAVKRGDYITTSDQLSHAMKAKQPGMMLGVALEDSANNRGLLKIRVQVEWVNEL